MDIRNAVQYFGMDATKVECPVAKDFVGKANRFYEMFSGLPSFMNGEKVIIDSRLSMLKPGWYPCIPGWHYDEVARDKDGNLDWENNDESKMHFIMVIDQGTGSLTEIATMQTGDVFPKVSDYTQLNEWMKENEGNYSSSIIESEKVYPLFNKIPHRGTPATGHGWRYFIRATFKTQREFVNETRTQTQVYIPAVDVGW